MATLLLEVKKKMDITGIVTYSLYVDDVLAKTANDISEIKELTQCLKDGFHRGELEEVVIYSEILDSKNIVNPETSLDINPSPVIEKPI